MNYRSLVYRGIAIALVIFFVGVMLGLARMTWNGEPPRAILRFLAGFAPLSVISGILISWAWESATASSHGFYAGGAGVPGPILDLSRIRSHLKREEWDLARSALDRQWAQYPGNGDLLREYERYFVDALGAPSGAVKFLEEQVPVLKGDDRAYAFMRLAELHADVLHEPEPARHWCHRLLTEFPSSPLAEQTRALLDSLPPERRPA
ncbi:MAG: hypothetical protein AAB152_05045 [Candidatus Coatesbacteria bacterium]